MAVSEEKNGTDLHTVRDTVESIWVAIVLAFVLRAFMVEAFVIPTGSMAPRLMGEHWYIKCDKCGYEYSYGAPKPQQQGLASQSKDTFSGAFCPNCSKKYNGNAQYRNNGDKVLVLKYIYNFREPRRWDVIVFVNPQGNRDNYIKRLVGLPGETIEIVHGNVFVSSSGADGPFEVCRKPDKAQNAMWQVVYDNDYRPDAKWLEDSDCACPQWLPDKADMWRTADNGRVFEFVGAGEGTLLLEAQSPKYQRQVFLPRYGYNQQDSNVNIDSQTDMCSDLRLSASFQPASKDASLSMTLGSFEHRFKAEISAGGKAVLWYFREGDEPVEWDSADIATLDTDRPHEVVFTHLDLQVMLKIDGREILRSPDSKYPENHDSLKKRLLSGVDVPPPHVAISAAGGPSRISHVKLMRDVYYTESQISKYSDSPLCKYAKSPEVERQNGGDYRKGWGVINRPITLEDFDDDDLDEFFVLGDNSPCSLDGRSWIDAAPTLRLWCRKKDGKVTEILDEYEDGAEPLYKLGTVPRYSIIGRALFVYWPSGFRLPQLPGLPIIPNFGRMRFIR